MNVVIYARFSSHSQTEQSIEGQLKACYEYAERNSYTVIGEYIDRALTGTNDNRPEFLRMIEDSRKKTFQGILVYQLDRFADFVRGVHLFSRLDVDEARQERILADEEERLGFALEWAELVLFGDCATLRML